MSESNETADKSSKGRKPLSLQRTVESGHVQQKFGPGRVKSVMVEKKRKRTVSAPSSESAQPSARRSARPGGGQSGGSSAGGLSKNEMSARAAALAAAHLRATEDERLAEQRSAEEAVRAAKRAEEDARLSEEAKRAAAEAAQRAQAEAASKAAPNDTAETNAQPEAVAHDAPAPVQTPAKSKPRQRAEPASGEQTAAQEPLLKSVPGMTRPMIVTRRDRPEAKAPEVAKPEAEAPRRTFKPAPAVETRDDEDDRGKRKVAGGKGARTPTRDETRVRGKLTIANALDVRQRERSIASLKRKREREKLKAMGVSVSREKIIREVVIPEAITIQDLANRMTERSVDIIKYLMKQGEMHTINDVIDADMAELLVTEFGHTPKRVSESDVEEGFFAAEGTDDDAELESRAPVVTIMGHVDHGKTSLLDAIRSAKVASGEAGGITQHIGAYQIETDAGNKITFIDTPGHEAFTAMRARGAKVTDIVILVVAADDGVMPQTIEAINHAKAAGVPMIVAINKMDVPAADPQRVRTELLQHSVVVESMSGETLDVEVSALKQQNLDGLLETIQLQSEILDLKANPNRSAEGFVIEAKLERGRGPVGTLLVQRGTLSVGDIVVAGTSWGRVRALIDDRGQNTAKAGPSSPVEVLGFDSAPEAGDQFAVVENEARAREITNYRLRKRRDTLGSAGSARTLEQMMQQLHEAGQKEFSLVVKGDVQGSIEAIAGALGKISTDEVQARIVHSGVGGITESDISLALASNAIVVGFNVRANVQAKTASARDGVEIRYYNIIYDLVDDVKAAMSGMLDPTLREIFLGNAQILEVFNISKVGRVAGCKITEGRVERGAKVRLIRDNVVIHEGTLSTLKRFKDEVKEVPVGQECGMAFANYEDIRAGDIIECFQVEVIQRTLDDVMRSEAARG